ncbi:phosphatidylglycerolphosphate synthase [Suhomyces tanzawaensis NRRL Y-17324]|uniref:CDP-diacylglycerol--glycerol-3-phosphate 3-phosphatidyltransferase n=1 Tax=Suhomyces tanzawaensis NRRL Y-17324 TaxID=984487 RepID=A0A1E4SRB6_9ASCO|nr:phosphatidylglycerolphosphate synthase [Suhomyces tanzawaensis NRRL Y-17324]ODV82056.1 phosphatidylglycerolphosphate synthase [Suhomyces tanzawaensis NRRL Y-17324]
MWSVFSYLFPAREQPQRRTYATNNPPLLPTIDQQFHPKLRVVMKQLDSIAPRFPMKRGDIEILNRPDQFYSTLKAKIASAKSRIFLSSLYVGKTQTELIQCLDDALAASADLKVYILIDALRGTREAPDNVCSASLLTPLVAKFGKHRVDVRMYHTPNLAGMSKAITPKRFNETYGLQHMKLYGFDNEIMLSGANLSHDYFTDRQDRYYVFRSSRLTDYYYKIQEAISSISYQVLPSQKLKQGFRLTWPTSNASCEPHMNIGRFISDTSYMLDPLLKQQQLSSFDEFDDTDDYDTLVYPVSQFTPLFPKMIDNSTEKPAVLRLLSYLDTSSIKWWFTAGYFNMLPEIQDRLINGKSAGSVITASPKANSFYKSSGVSYYVPEAYLLFAKKFLEEVARIGKSSMITVFEWQRGVVNTLGGWSYHAKGMWLTAPDEEVPSITVVGSSNYTKRAYSLDLESNAIIITKDEVLKQQMKDEITNLMTYAKKLELTDFQPKPKQKKQELESSTPDTKTNPHVDVSENAIQAIDTVATMDDDSVHLVNKDDDVVYEVDEDRKISYGVQLALKLLGGRF